MGLDFFPNHETECRHEGAVLESKALAQTDPELQGPLLSPKGSVSKAQQWHTGEQELRPTD